MRCGGSPYYLVSILLLTTSLLSLLTPYYVTTYLPAPILGWRSCPSLVPVAPAMRWYRVADYAAWGCRLTPYGSAYG